MAMLMMADYKVVDDVVIMLSRSLAELSFIVFGEIGVEW